MASDLNEKFANVTLQMHEYKKRFLEATEKLRDLDSKLEEVETRLDATEDENIKLKEDLKSGAGSGLAGKDAAHQQLGGGAVRGGGGLTQQEIEMNKRSEQIRKALLSDDDGDEVAVSMDALLKSKDIRAIIQGWVALHMPFKRDLRQIQAKFGSSIASYFTFSRFM